MLCRIESRSLHGFHGTPRHDLGDPVPDKENIKHCHLHATNVQFDCWSLKELKTNR